MLFLVKFKSLTYLFLIIFLDFINNIKIFFTKNKKDKNNFLNIYKQYFEKLKNLNDEEKQVLSKKTFEKYMLIIDSFNDFDINVCDQNGYLPLEYIISLHCSTDYVKMFIEKYKVNTTLLGNNNKPFISVIAEMSNIELFNYWHEKKYHNIKILPEHNIFVSCVTSKKSNLTQKYLFLKMLFDKKFELDTKEISKLTNSPTVFLFSNYLLTRENIDKHYDILRQTLIILIKLGMNINEKNKFGETIIMLIVAKKINSVVKLYTELGSNLFEQCDKGFLPIDYAKIHKAIEIERYLNTKMLLQLSNKISILEKQCEMH